MVQPAECEALYRELLEPARKRAVDDPSRLETALAEVAEVLFREEKHGDAEALQRERLQSQLARLPASDDTVVGSIADLAGLLTEWAWTGRSLADKAPSLTRAREAERLLRDCLSARTLALGPGSSRLADTKSRLGGALLVAAVVDPDSGAGTRETKLVEAEPLLLQGSEEMLRSRNATTAGRRDAIARLVRFYEIWNKPAQATEWYEKLEAFDRAEARK